jgi:hypothetical protein
LAFIDSIDTYYGWMYQQMQMVNPARVASMLGYALATDWPQLELTDGGIYLLYVNSVDTGKGTKHSPLYTHFLQWVWLLLGTDIQASQVAANRGDRLRTHAAIQEDLRQGNFPGFCQKATFTPNTQTGSGNYTQSNPEEMIRWTELKMPTKWNIKAGAIYGTAAVEVYAYDPVQQVVNASVLTPPQVLV